MRPLLAVLAAALLLPAASGGAQTGAPSPYFEVQRLADGVYAVIRKEPPGMAVDANNLFVVGEDGVLVVDSNLSPESTREVLGALRRITDKPVLYVVNTHWHDDHVMGNEVYRDEFPGAVFVGHARTREYLPTTGETNRKRTLAGVPDFVAALRSSVERNVSLGGGPLSEEERQSHLSDIRLGERFLRDVPRLRVVLPELTFEDRIVLHLGERAVEVRSVGPGHTAGDVVVYLPKERIVAAGDLVVWPVPLVGGEQSHVVEWSATLERLQALSPAVLVPGHGPVMRDGAYVRTIAEMFASIRAQAEAARSRGESLDEARKSVDLAEFRRRLAGDSRLRNLIFSNYVAAPAVAAVYRQLAEARPSPAAQPSPGAGRSTP